MLKQAGAPETPNDSVSEIILETGTMWHERVAGILVKAGVPFMQEVRLNKWLPQGWGGTADWIFYHPEYSAFVLGDLKTTTGEGIAYIDREGIKEAHHHQLSAYWYALRDMGIPLLDSFGVLYLPKNRAKNYDTRPLLIEAKPLDENYMLDLMHDRRERVNSYLHSISADRSGEQFITDELADPIERVQKVAWNKDHWELKLVPHWLAQFCPYDISLCDCSTQGETKVGEWVFDSDWGENGRVEYIPRRGYSHIEAPELTSTQLRRLGVTRDQAA